MNDREDTSEDVCKGLEVWLRSLVLGVAEFLRVWGFFTALLLEVSGILGLIVTRIVPDLRFWPPPSFWSVPSLVFRSMSVLLGAASFYVGWMDYGSLRWSMPYLPHLGFLLVALGVFLVIGGIVSLGWEEFAGTGGSLTTEGLYAYTRNPQYLGHVLATSGFVLLFRSVLVLILGVVACLGLLYLPRVEEDYLAEAFGEEFQAYREETPRFLIF